MKHDSSNLVVRYDGDTMVTRYEESTLLPGGDGTPRKALTRKGVNRVVNNALANLLKADLPKLIEAQFKPLKETVDQIVANASNGGEKGGNPPSGGEGNGSSKLPPEVQMVLNDLQRSNKDLGAKLKQMEDAKIESEKKAEQSDRNAAIRAELQKYNFASDSAADAAYRLINLEVQRDDEGNLIAGNLPLPAFVKEALTTKHDYFLASKEVGGAGAQRTTQRRTAAPSLDDIKKDMSAEKRAEIAQAIIQNYQAAQQGQ